MADYLKEANGANLNGTTSIETRPLLQSAQDLPESSSLSRPSQKGDKVLTFDQAMRKAGGLGK